MLIAVPASAALAKPERVPVCHLDEFGEATLRLVPERAVDAHLRHGDALPEDRVPGMTDYTFDESCTPVLDELTETVFAVAYTDVDPSDGGYNAAVDVLIAKLIDGPDDAGDGFISVGDLVITNQYPLVHDLDGPFTFGDFTVTEHIVTRVNYDLAVFISVSAQEANFLEANFLWVKQSEREAYQENFPSSRPGGVTSVGDLLNDDGLDDDVIIVEVPGPSNAQEAVDFGEVSHGDDAFIDVEINLPQEI
jgi:hypothetical protein